ncbi:MAG: hypothetical protein A2161_20795 [Candidatus Schekmanbacteria bacterium RBG_13_48_7]|uniref:Uncharacterized protein n=1 Tax=Candidatus Schekmanbacteria bacterium RBG_13_48_7 TaxID=1817878 RepID=A0A1F7S3P6_9BACT|nr:MAG: hypothetical protein A2161_20795 [Candidatus Schekmanbacteria bacterium RBG_13_48_7]
MTRIALALIMNLILLTMANAEVLSSYGGCYNSTILHFESDSKLSLTSYGINLSGFVGNRFGWPSELNILFLQDGKIENKNQSSSIDVGSSFGLDGFSGYGGIHSISSKWKFYWGGGIHVQGMFFISDDIEQSYINLGPGGNCSILYHLSDSWSIKMGTSVAYDLVMLILVDERFASDFTGGTSVSPSIGITYHKKFPF